MTFLPLGRAARPLVMIPAVVVVGTVGVIFMEVRRGPEDSNTRPHRRTMVLSMAGGSTWNDGAADSGDDAPPHRCSTWNSRPRRHGHV